MSRNTIIRKWLTVSKAGFALHLAIVLACALAQTVRATDYVRLTANDGSTESSFVSQGHWSDGKDPHSDADYIVTNNYLLRSSGYNRTFVGRSLTIGTPSSNGRIGIIEGQTTVNDLILVNGQLRVLSSEITAPLYGKITVQSSAIQPFSVQSGSSDRTMHIYSSIYGEEGTGLIFKGDSTPSYCTNRLFGANANYLGSFTIGGHSGNALIFEDAESVAGGDPSTPTPKGIVVKDGAMLSFNTDRITYVNRGLYVESSGGVLRQDGTNLLLNMPLNGDSGARLVKTGPDETVFSNTWDNVTVEVSEGAFTLGNGCPVPGAGAGVVVSGGTFAMCGGSAQNLPIQMTSGFISPYGADAGDLLLSNVDVDDGGIRISYANGRYDTLTFGDGCNLSAETLNVDIVNLQHPTNINRYPVLVVPDSVANLTMENISVSFPETDEYSLPACLKAELEKANGTNTLYVSRTNGVVYLKTNQISSGSWSSASAWSDNEGLRGGVDFLISAEQLTGSSAYFAARTPNNNDVETFPGRSLSIVGTDTITARVLIKSLALSGDDIRLGANSWICASGAGDSSLQQYVTGTVTVASSATSEKPAIFATAGDRTIEVRAELKGSGVVGVSTTRADQSATALLTRGNPDFHGKFLVVVSGSATNFLCIASEECLGAAPSKLQRDMVTVEGGGRFGVVDQNVTVDDPTRGITFMHQSGVVAKSSDSKLTLKSPITFNQSFYMSGDGTVVLDSTNVVVNATGAIYLEGDGCLQVNRPGMFWGYSRFRFNPATGAALLFPREPANEESGTYGIAMNNGSESMCPFTRHNNNNAYLPVKIDLGDTPPSSTFRVALCSVTPAAADSLRGHIEVLTSVKGFNCEIVEDDVTYNETPLKRFSCVFRRKGMSIIFR